MADSLVFWQVIAMLLGVTQICTMAAILYTGMQFKLLRAELVSRAFCDERHNITREYLDDRYDQVRDELNRIHVSLGEVRSEVNVLMNRRGDA